MLVNKEINPRSGRDGDGSGEDDLTVRPELQESSKTKYRAREAQRGKEE